MKGERKEEWERETNRETEVECVREEAGVAPE